MDYKWLLPHRTNPSKLLANMCCKVTIFPPETGKSWKLSGPPASSSIQGHPQKQELVELGSTGHWAYGYGGYGSIENPGSYGGYGSIENGSGYESETSTQSLCSTQGSWRFDAADLSKLLQFSTASLTDKVDQHLPESWISLDISL